MSGATHLLDVDEASEGARLDTWLARLLPDVSRSQAAALIRAGQVLDAELDAPLTKPSLLLRLGMRVRVVIPPPIPLDARPQAIDLDILYEDETLVVVHKPAGMATHPGPGTPDGTLVNALLYHVRDLSGIGGTARPGIVHRLDKTTSGVLVVAKNDQAHHALSAQFKARTVEKEYRAFARGAPDPPRGTIEAPIARHPRERKLMAVVPNGRPSRTDYKTLRSWGHHSHLAFQLHTGRTHQLRVHAQWLGHPIVGDVTYGYHVAPSWRAALTGLLRTRPGVYLHAYRLSLLHPRHGERMEWIAEEPEDFAALATALDGIR